MNSLTGIRVVDVTTNVSGPFATQILGDLGATVIKVERPGSGDDTRSWGPPFWCEDVESVTFSTLNRNKQSIALDLRDEDDRGIFETLVQGADVLVQNMRPGAFERLGYTYARLTELNSTLIYAEISGFGPKGPRSNDPAYDPLIQAFSGLMSITGEKGRPPVRIPVSIVDKGTGLWTAIGVLNALRLREQDGSSQHVHTSLLETALSWEPSQLMGYIAADTIAQRLGSGAPGIAPYEAFKANDDYIIVAAANQRLWERLCACLERGDLLDDPRFASNDLRFANRSSLASIINDALSRETVRHWLSVFARAGIPAAPIRSVDEVIHDRQVQATEIIQSISHPSIPNYAMVGLPITTNGSRHPIKAAPPELDADRSSILKDLLS